MGNEWETLTLRDAGIILIDCVHKTPPAAACGYPYIAIPQLKDGRILHSEARRITDADYREWTRKAKPQAFDVVLSRRCNPGETAYVPPGLEFALGQNLVLLRADGTRVYPPFLRWLVRSVEWWDQIGKFINVGAVFNSLKCADIPRFELTIPPLDEQHAIAHILGSLDDKIELNRQMNRTLEKMAQAIFKSWFIDFDPVRAKAEGRDPGLPKEIADLFPDSFEDSELGPIPKGWKVKPLDEIAHFQNGLALQKYRPKPGEARLPVVKIAQLRAGQANGDEWTSTSIKPECIIDDGDVVFSWSGTLLLKVWCGGRAALNQHLFKVTSEKYPKWFYIYWIKKHLPEFIRIASDKATTMGHIKRHHLAEATCVVCDELLLEKVNEVFENLLEQQIHNEIESRSLTVARDTLLPKLISGELRVPDVEKFIEEAGV